MKFISQRWVDDTRRIMQALNACPGRTVRELSAQLRMSSIHVLRLLRFLAPALVREGAGRKGQPFTYSLRTTDEPVTIESVARREALTRVLDHWRGGDRDIRSTDAVLTFIENGSTGKDFWGSYREYFQATDPGFLKVEEAVRGVLSAPTEGQQ